VREKYKMDFLNLENQLFTDFRKAGIDFASISTTDDYVKPLMKLFQQRGR
jgi:hypothetical protein